MIRICTLTALAFAVAFGGAAMAQQASGAATASGGTSAQIGAPASDETGVKGVYATKRIVGISTGPTALDDTEGSEQRESSAEAKEESDQPVSN